MRALTFLVFGGVAIALALWMALPVGVNLPDSWFGALLIALLIAAGCALVYAGVRALKKQSHSRRKSKPNTPSVTP